MGALCLQFLHYRHRVGYARAFDDLVSVQNQRFRVAAFFIGNIPMLKNILVFLLDAPIVGKEDIEALDFCEDSGTCAAFSSSQYYYSGHELSDFQ